VMNQCQVMSLFIPQPLGHSSLKVGLMKPGTRLQRMEGTGVASTTYTFDVRPIKRCVYTNKNLV